MGLRHNRVTEVCGGTWSRMWRTKKVSSGVMETPLRRCLSTLDLTLLGIGHMVGAGIYVLTGTVAKDTAGPGIILSFLLAGFASLLSALCYAEFGARVPKAGSAYVYTYVVVGEFWAFVIGWNILLEHMIGAASVARAWSGYVDSLFNKAISNYTMSVVGNMHVDHLAEYPDFLAFFVTLLYSCLLCLGVKGSSNFNAVFTVINMCVVTFVIVAGLYYSDISNWNTEGGFLPYGFSGVIAGAGTCFFAFVGFDSIATAGEEAKNPAKSIPQATLISMSFVSLAYVLVGATLTLMVPYYNLNPAAALPDAFAAHGASWAKYTVSVGALCGMTTTMFGSLFSLPRCVYAMAVDGLLFSWLARVSEKTKLPTLTLIICGICCALIALLFNIEELVEFMSIGTLMAYTIVSGCVIVLRYQPGSRCNIQSPTQTQIPSLTPADPCTPTSMEEHVTRDEGGELKSTYLWLLPVLGHREPGIVGAWSVVIFFLVSCGLFVSLQFGGDYFALSHLAVWAGIIIALLFLVLLFCVIVIVAHHQNDLQLTFRVPLVPYLPLLSIFLNVGLMMHLNHMTWMRFIIWMALGLVLYFAYGQHHSREGQPVSSYTTLLSEPAQGDSNSTVFGSVQQTLSHVTAKIASATASEDKKPIVERRESVTGDL